jgi:hypothetical protein
MHDWGSCSQLPQLFLKCLGIDKLLSLARKRFEDATPRGVGIQSSPMETRTWSRVLKKFTPAFAEASVCDRIAFA